MSDHDLRATYTRFRILVIGRANAGKTTLLQRVCNTTEDPCIYDDDKNLVSVQRPEDKFCFWKFQLAWTYFSRTPFFIDIQKFADLSCQRGIHDIHRPFGFQSNPGFIFHDSPGFESGDEKQLQEVLLFMEKKAKSTEVDDQLHAIWSVSLFRRTYWPLMVSFAVKGFVWFWTKGGLYYHWKRHSLRRRGHRKVSIILFFKSKINILQYLSSRSLPSSMIWWHRSMTWMKMTRSIANMRKK